MDEVGDAEKGSVDYYQSMDRSVFRSGAVRGDELKKVANGVR